jgi:hypothetical protein
LDVTPLVKRSSLPTIPLAVRSIPLTKVLAKAAPGSVGSVTCRPPPPLRDEDVRTELLPLRALCTLGTQGR